MKENDLKKKGLKNCGKMKKILATSISYDSHNVYESRFLAGYDTTKFWTRPNSQHFLQTTNEIWRTCLFFYLV